MRITDFRYLERFAGDLDGDGCPRRLRYGNTGASMSANGAAGELQEEA